MNISRRFAASDKRSASASIVERHQNDDRRQLCLRRSLSHHAVAFVARKLDNHGISLFHRDADRF
jgi:hypothetical protein